MSVLKIGKCYHYRFEYKGKVIRKSTKQGDKRTAEAMEALHLTNLVKGEVALIEKPNVPTLREFLSQRVLPFAAKQKPTTATWFRSGIKPLLESQIAKVALDAITSEQISDYIAHRDGYATGTINRELRVLRRSLRLAVEWKVLETAPAISMAGPEAKRERVVSDEEFARYIACASPLLAEVARILFESGLRPEECHRLEWPDISFARNRLLVRYGKTAAARRQIPLSRNVRGVLESRWQDAGRPETGFVFVAPTKSGHIEHYTLKKQHRNALRRSGVRGFLLYSLRHSFATRIAPRVDAWTLCRIMGWASLSIAMTYVHANEKNVLDAFSGQGFGHAGDQQLPDNFGDQRQVADGIDGYMVSAVGLEPTTHALKGHCSTN
jgi:integrase